MTDGKTPLACVIGWPVAHSRSPLLHNYWLRRYKIDGAYVPLAVPPESLREALQSLPGRGFRGANVTFPHKEEAFRIIGEHDEAARACRAVNTILCRQGGPLLGMNTDGFGFVGHLKQAAPGFCPAIAVIFGAGGAARAIAHALSGHGAEQIRLVNRTKERAESLAADLAGAKTRLSVFSWRDYAKALSDAGLMINATTLGMAGAPSLDIDLSPLSKSAIVADAVYVPLETALLRAARKRGLAALDGLGMLIHQARPAFRAWFGVDPEITAELRAILIEDLQRDT